MPETQNWLRLDSVALIAVAAGFSFGLLNPLLILFLRTKVDRKTISISKVKVALLIFFSSLFGALLFYSGSVAMKFLDPSVSAVELNRLNLAMFALSTLSPLIERFSLSVLTRFGIFKRQQ